jgi:D-sedoheptulose 7-phosphate isomerase
MEIFLNYSERLQRVLASSNWDGVASLAQDILNTWNKGGQVFLCGNGGSAGNAIHLANDFLYGVTKTTGLGIRVNALSSNPAILTCLANDLGYEHIFSEQIAVYGMQSDLLVVLSGSGNSPNILNVLNMAKDMSIKSYAILGFDGGVCKKIADVPIHFEINDMQISEDLQLVVGHMVMQWLSKNSKKKN